MEAHLIRAQQLIRQERFALAIEQLELALAEDIQDVRALGMLALAQVKLNQYQLAQETIIRALSISPENARLHYLASLVLEHSDRAAEAMAEIREAIRLSPEEADFYGKLAGLHVQRNEFKTALEISEEGLQFDPEHSTCNNFRSLCLVRLGRREEANQALQAALRRSPDDPFNHACLGWEKLAENDFKQAAIHFREALRLEPNSEWAREGIISSLKARNFVFRIFLSYALFLGRFNKGVQWGILIGLYAFSRVVRLLGEAIPALAPWTTVFLIGYAGFVVFTWITNPLFNLFLLLDPFGRLALTPTERRVSIIVGALLTGSLLSLVLGISLTFVLPIPPVGLYVGVIVLLVFVVPVSSIASCEPGWPRIVGIVFMCALFVTGILFVSLMPPFLFFLPEEQQTLMFNRALWFGLPFGLLALCTTVLFNFLPSYEVKK